MLLISNIFAVNKHINVALTQHYLAEKAGENDEAGCSTRRRRSERRSNTAMRPHSAF
jgi:hypothetical protein